MKRAVAAVLSMILITMAVSPYAYTSTLSDWYDRKTESGQEETLGEETTQDQTAQEAVQEVTIQDSDIPSQADEARDGYAVPQVQLKMTEQKILSPAFGNAVVGRTMIPEGWTMKVTDLSIGTVSISCPNAIGLEVTDPTGEYSLYFISKREFRQQIITMMGSAAASEDDVYDFSTMTHTLNYREADAACDYMTNLLFGNGYVFQSQKSFSEEEVKTLRSAREKYEEEVWMKFDAFRMGLQGQKIIWTDVTAAQRTYSDGNDVVTFNLVSAGYEMDYSAMKTLVQTYNWCMPAVFAMKTPAPEHDRYQEVFDVFCLTTAVSQEFEQLRTMNSERLVKELTIALNDGKSYSPSQGSWDEYESMTVDTGDSYTSFEAWDDYILGQSDYTTGDGTHVKIPSDYEHVFEGDNGTIYAGSSSDGPGGSLELSPSQIGE